MDTVLLILRVALSLAAVLALLWWVSRKVQTGMAGRRQDAPLSVISRQHLGRRTGVALIEVSGRRLVVGYSDQEVRLVHDAGDAPVEEPTASVTRIDPAFREEATVPASDAATTVAAFPTDPVRTMPARMADSSRFRSPLEGSILAPDTWRKAVVAVQERTTRRS